MDKKKITNVGINLQIRCSFWNIHKSLTEEKKLLSHFIHIVNFNSFIYAVSY